MRPAQFKHADGTKRRWVVSKSSPSGPGIRSSLSAETFSVDADCTARNDDYKKAIKVEVQLLPRMNESGGFFFSWQASCLQLLGLCAAEESVSAGSAAPGSSSSAHRACVPPQPVPLVRSHSSQCVEQCGWFFFFCRVESTAQSITGLMRLRGEAAPGYRSVCCAPFFNTRNHLSRKCCLSRKCRLSRPLAQPGPPTSL
jgi:hypothetical protein